MLLFFCAEKSRLAALGAQGIDAPEGVWLWTSLEAARQACPEALVVVDPARTDAPVPADGDGRVWVPRLPPEALRNVDPYLPPVPVDAAGGYVMRAGRHGPEVLLIFRRGIWDLPKGKCEAGEPLPECALREVREEVGIEALRLVRALGTTVHGYPRRGRYEVKTTHWYLMETTATRFTPQAEEDIEAVAWVPWGEARQKVGFATLQRHMAAVEPLVFEAFDLT